MVLWIDELEVWVGLESRVEGELNLRGFAHRSIHLSGAKGILWMACFLESNQRNFKDKRCLMLGVIIILLFHVSTQVRPWSIWKAAALLCRCVSSN